MSEENSVVETDQGIVAPDIPERSNIIDRTMSLNIQSDTGGVLSDDADDDSPPDLSGVKISLHLSMDQGQMMMQSGTGSKTKKFLESDDAIISQIFSQTICSAGVTPTDESEEFFAGNDEYGRKKLSSSIESPNRSPNSNEEEDEEMNDDEDDDGLIKGASRLTILNNQQRPSIVIDCFDETPPISPPEEMTPSAGAAFYFHTTIVDEDDVEENNSDPSNGDNSSFDQSSSAQLNDDMHLDDELLQQAVAIVDNFTTIVEDDDDIVDQIIATDDIELETATKTDNPNNTSCTNNDNDTLTISNEETTINQTYKELAETETNEAPTHFLANTNGGFEPPEPALVQLNQVDPIGYTNGSGMGHESDDDEDDDSCSNNLTAKTFSFDDEQSSSVEHHSEEAYEEEHVIEIDESGKKKVTSKSSKSALAASRATASVETKANGVSKKATMEAIEEKSATEHAKAITNGNTTVEAIETNTEETRKITGTATPNNNKRKVRKIKKGSGDSEKENISVHSSIIMFNNICNGSLNNTETMRSISPTRVNGKYQASPSPSPPPLPLPIPSNKFVSNNKTTSYYHTFNCSRDMKKRKSVNNFLNRDMTNNTINELKNNFERLIEETQRQAGKKIINNNSLRNSTNGNSNNRIFCNRQDILMNTDRRNKKLTSNGDDLSNIDVKSLVTWIPRKKQSVRSKSFSKFDALQKSASKTTVNGGKPGAPLPPIENNCKACGKTVFQMEQIKAERSIWHKNCFRCEECQKQLNFDTYESHEGKLFCKPHFKSLFSPKVVEDNEPVKPRKPQMIIAENQPVELPADVVRSSDKTDSGLEELQQLNLKSRFEVFEKGCTTDEKKDVQLDRSPSGVKRSASILSKLARFQAKGMEVGNIDTDGIPIEYSSEEEEEEIDTEETHEEVLERARRAQKEKPIVCANMDDIKTRFESGHVTTREERREEQKQELQSIRSRLFMGKQAKIKEMYQQAVEQSEQTVTASKVDCDVDLERARSIKEKFEKGSISQDDTDDSKTKVPEEELAVFEQGISKQSRSIFKELDANVAKQPASLPSPNISNSKTSEKRRQFEQQMTSSCEVVKSGEKIEDVHIATEEVSSKFKFFETYKPGETKKKEFRITPPRDGVVKMPSPEADQKNGINDVDNPEDDSAIAAKTHTASKMLSLFRQMEEKKHTQVDAGPKPLKRFTPPPDDNKRIYQDQDSAEEYTDEEVEEEEYEEEEEEEHQTLKSEEEGLRAAKEAARAKLLREKFERWEKSQIEKEQREQNSSSVNLYDDTTDEGQVESARSIRAKFETLQETRTVQKEQIKVNRFVVNDEN